MKFGTINTAMYLKWASNISALTVKA